MAGMVMADELHARDDRGHRAPDPHRVTRDYYDDFAQRYEAERGVNRPGGYHALIDDLEVPGLRFQ